MGDKTHMDIEAVAEACDRSRSAVGWRRAPGPLPAEIMVFPGITTAPMSRQGLSVGKTLRRLKAVEPTPGRTHRRSRRSMGEGDEPGEEETGSVRRDL